jgi:hypothetical protein
VGPKTGLDDVEERKFLTLCVSVPPKFFVFFTRSVSYLCVSVYHPNFSVFCAVRVVKKTGDQFSIERLVFSFYMFGFGESLH